MLVALSQLGIRWRKLSMGEGQCAETHRGRDGCGAFGSSNGEDAMSDGFTDWTVYWLELSTSTWSSNASSWM
jgi:hypothetical protein